MTQEEIDELTRKNEEWLDLVDADEMRRLFEDDPELLQALLWEPYLN